MPTTSQVISAFETAMSTSLSITVRAGLPEVGRTTVTYPIGAVLFSSDEYSMTRLGTQRPRIGQVPPTGTMMTADLYLFASNEYNLFSLIDALRTAKASVASVEAGGVDVVVKWGATQRTQVFDTDKVVENTIVTPVTFSW